MVTTDQSETVQSAALRVWALLFGIGLLLAGNGLQSSLLGLVAEDSGFSSVMTGFIMTAYFVGFLAGSSASESFISKVGHVRTFAALAALSSAAILVHGLFVEPTIWMLMRFVTGFSFAGLYVVTESWLNRETTSAHRGALLAFYMLVSHLGLASGQALLNTAPSTELTLYVAASVILSLAVLPILLSSAPQPQINIDVERLALRALFRTTPLGTVGCFLAGLGNGIVLGMAAVYARQLGYDIATISTFMAAIMIGGAVFQWPVGKLSDRFDRRQTILGVALVTAVASIALDFADANAATFALAGFVAGGLTLTLYPLFLSYANDWFTADQMVSAASGLVLVYGAGAMLGPIGTGVLMSIFGPSGFTYYLTALLVGTAGFTAYRIAFTDGPTEQEDFLYSPPIVGVAEYWGECAAEGSEDTEGADPEVASTAALVGK